MEQRKIVQESTNISDEELYRGHSFKELCAREDEMIRLSKERFFQKSRVIYYFIANDPPTRRGPERISEFFETLREAYKEIKPLLKKKEKDSRLAILCTDCPIAYPFKDGPLYGYDECATIERFFHRKVD